MEISKLYDPASVEDKWYTHWMEQEFFKSVPDERTPYTIVIPPPNVTGVLHMGHMLNNTIQDVLIRKARLEGFNACWVPGTDHASIATEAKVVKMLREKGIKKSNLSRKEFLDFAWEWKDKYGGIILEQLKKLGASCDWDRTRFTMEDGLSEAVIHVFVDLYHKGYIYKGRRIINWDPKAMTALSNEEVIYKEVTSKLYHVRYKVEGSDEILTIATTRPETILGDTAICVNPKDERYHHLKGKKAIVPIVNRVVPIIEDHYVDMEFGTGALKITPAHDPNDYEIGKKHDLEVVDMLNDDGTVSEAGQFYVGEPALVARDLIIEDIDKAGQLEKVEEFKNSVGYSERTDVVVEPKLSMQWFLDMKELSTPALENVMNDTISFFPKKFKNSYKHWMENIREWCLSRQLWWGQRIPAYYLEDETFVVAKSPEEALETAKKKTGNRNLTMADLRQDEDVLDTWASSWLWPISVFDGFKDPKNKDIEYYYPTNVLVTAPEILFFWVARMIMAGYEYKNDRPFKDVYLTGIVRDKKRRKMSKSLGNSPEPLELMKRYGADGVRVGMLLSSPAGNDLLFDEKLCEQGRNFSNKIWNVLRLLKGWKPAKEQNSANGPAVRWFENKLLQTMSNLESSYSEYRLSECLNALYNLFWNDFANWYLEMIKPGSEKVIDEKTYEKTLDFFERLMKLLHPFMPFITEEVWHTIRERSDEKDCIIVSKYPETFPYNADFINDGDEAIAVITKIREIRSKSKVKNVVPIDCFYICEDKAHLTQFNNIISKLANLKTFEETSKEIDNTQTFVIRGDKFFVDTGVTIDTNAEKQKLESELDYTKGFIKIIEKKLNNEKFVANAPDQVVANERKKLADGLAKLKVLEETISSLD